MKSSIKILALAAVCLAGCAKTPTTDYGNLTQMEFDAWIAVNKQAGWQETPLGCWITEIADNPAGKELGSLNEYPYMRIDYTVSDLDGTVNSTTCAAIAQKIGSYNQSYYYGPQVNHRGQNSIYAGVEDAISNLHEGGRCKVIVPGWLLTHDRFSTKQKYLDNMTESVSPLVYDITVTDLIADIEAWELGLVKTAIGNAKADSLDAGVFYVCDKAADDSTDYTSSDQVYINYICRRLIDGQGVDTNIADSAKVFGIYKSGSSYGPTLINWASESKDITMTSSNTSVISGFSSAIFHMHAHEKGRAFMTSTYAYQSSGSGSAIPGFCPLIFEIEFVDKPSE
ncbi:MAG: FKBP-type peptidyl-prolyl cis-trans isomerase [Bacteroidales bacterium]|nr:FKBP-type peptidyl-prolyl cis-trans isomerase [Bacteroidales bacterium]